MLFGLITGGLTLVVVATLVVAFVRGGPKSRPAAANDLDVRRDQQKEVERDVERGVVSPADAERTVTEEPRRLLATDAALQRAQTGTARGRTTPVIAGLTAVVLIGGALAIYLQRGAPGYGDQAPADRIDAEKPQQQPHCYPDAAEKTYVAVLNIEGLLVGNGQKIRGSHPSQRFYPAKCDVQSCKDEKSPGQDQNQLK